MTRSIALLLASTSGITGCARSVMPLYEAARAEALADPGPAPADWEPDAVLHLSDALIDEVLTALIKEYGTLKSTFDAGIASVTPSLKVQSLKLGRAKTCTDCLAVDASLDGTLEWRSPVGKGSADLSAELAFDAVFEVVQEGDAWTVRVAPRRLRDIEIDVAGKNLSYAEVPIRKWIDDNILDRVPAQTLVTLGSVDLPLRGVRPVAVGKTMQLQLLSASPTPEPIAVEKSPLTDGWALDLGTDALTDLARAAAFTHGPVGYEVVPEPTALTIEEDTFTLGLRLWRIKGHGWWRDYTVRGTVKRTGRGLTLKPESVEEQGKSAGAAWADPLALLGEGVILKTIEDAVATTLPSTHKAKVEGLQTVVEIGAIGGSGDRLTATGSLALKPGATSNTGGKKHKQP